MSLFRAYSEWRQNHTTRLDVQVEQEVCDMPSFNGTDVLRLEPTGRVRVVIEGERDLVAQALGKNWHFRLRKINNSVTAGGKS